MRKPVLHSALIAGALVTGLIAAPVAATAEVEVPQGLSITIDDGVDEVSADETVDYETTIGNTGADPVELTVVVTVPGYVEITDAGDASVDGVSATWTTTVEPQEPQTLTVSAKVGEIPETEYRVTTLASVYLGDEAEGSPVIRSADANKIPGVEDPVIETEKPATNEDEGEFPLLAVIIGVVVLALLVATALVIWTVRRKKRAADEKPIIGRSGSPAAAPEALVEDKTDAETPVVVAPAADAPAVVAPVETPVIEEEPVEEEPVAEKPADEAEPAAVEPVELEPVEDAVAQAEDAAAQAERAIAQVEESAASDIADASDVSAASDVDTDSDDGTPPLRRDLRRD